MKYYIVELEFKNYCENKKYDIFDDLTDVPEEEIATEKGVEKKDMAVSEIQGLKIQNEQLKKQIEELTKQLNKKKGGTITVKGKPPKTPIPEIKIEEEPMKDVEECLYEGDEDLDLARELLGS